MWGGVTMHQKATQEYEDLKKEEALELTPTGRQRLISLSKDLRSVWYAQTTTHSERKNLLRILIREVTLTPVDVPERRTREHV